MRGFLHFLFLCSLPRAAVCALILISNYSVDPLALEGLNETSKFFNDLDSPNVTASIDATVLPYRFAVPNTDLLLRLGFGLRRRLNPGHMQVLLVIAEDYVDQAIEEAGPVGGDDLFPIGDDGFQNFFKSLGDGMSLHVVNEAGQLFTLQQLKQVLVGLRLYLIDGQRFYETRFKFWNGPVLPEILTRTLGKGELIFEKVETGRVTSD